MNNISENSPIQGIELDCGIERLLDVIKINQPIVYIADPNVFIRESITFNNLPQLIQWLQDVYNYCIELKNDDLYVDWVTAREHMSKGNKAKLKDCTYWVEGEELYFDLYSEPNITCLSLPMIDSKEWILL